MTMEPIELVARIIYALIQLLYELISLRPSFATIKNEWTIIDELTSCLFN